MLSPILISLRAVGLSCVITGALAIIIAHWRVSRRDAWLDWIDGLLMLPMVLPPTVIGLILLLLLGRQSVIGQLLQTFGFNVVFSWPATVIAAVVVSFPIMYSMVLAAFRMVDRDLLDAAQVMGCSHWQTLWHVLLPVAWPGVAAGFLLSSARALGEFGATLMLAGNIPGQTETAPLAIYFSVESGETAHAVYLCFFYYCSPSLSSGSYKLWTPSMAVFPSDGVEPKSQ